MAERPTSPDTISEYSDCISNGRSSPDAFLTAEGSDSSLDSTSCATPTNPESQYDSIKDDAEAFKKVFESKSRETLIAPIKEENPLQEVSEKGDESKLAKLSSVPDVTEAGDGDSIISKIPPSCQQQPTSVPEQIPKSVSEKQESSTFSPRKSKDAPASSPSKIRQVPTSSPSTNRKRPAYSPSKSKEDLASSPSKSLEGPTSSSKRLLANKKPEAVSPVLKEKDEKPLPQKEEKETNGNILPEIIPREEFPESVTILRAPNGSLVYLIGTAHFSRESQQEVIKVIRQVQPGVIVIELCESRLSLLHLDERTLLEESKNLSFKNMRQIIRQNGLTHGILYLILLHISANLTRQLGMAPGGEFRAAYQEASIIPDCHLMLGDRSLSVTLKRAFASLSYWQKLKLAFQVLLSNDSISAEDIERLRRKDLLKEVLSEMMGDFPDFSRVFVHERDKYLAFMLKEASKKGERATVGVVGMGHVPGICANWETVTEEDIRPLMEIPETTLASKVIFKTVKYTFYGLIGYACYKVIPKSVKSLAVSQSLELFTWVKNKNMF